MYKHKIIRPHLSNIKDKVGTENICSICFVEISVESFHFRNYNAGSLQCTAPGCQPSLCKKKELVKILFASQSTYFEVFRICYLFVKKIWSDYALGYSLFKKYVMENICSN
jgi:hypothetical protein